MNVGKSVKIALVNNGKNQKWLAEEMGLSHQSISNLATSKTSPTETTIKNLADAFEMSASEFIALGE